MKKCILILALVLMTGCATLGMLADEVADIKAEEVQPQAQSIGVLIDGLIPGPYAMPASVVLGYVACLLRRLYKKKKGCKV